MTRPRTLAREAALKCLYQLDLRPALRQSELTEQLEEVANADAREFGRELLEGVRAGLGELDAAIEAAAHNWKLRRMAAIDRNILRLGAYELLHREDVPPAVSINEAVLLAKKYSTRESGGFVNGILDRIHRSRGGEPLPPVEQDPEAGPEQPPPADEEAPAATTAGPEAGEAEQERSQ